MNTQRTNTNKKEKAGSNQAERLKTLTPILKLLELSRYEELKPKEQKLFLAGFCYAHYYTDIIFQIASFSGRSETICRDLENLIIKLEGGMQ